MSESLAVTVRDLAKVYRGGFFRRRVQALNGVSLDVPRGEIFGLLGPNGAGKTTLIKILLGIVRKSAGSASVLGHVAGDRRGRRAIGYLPESHRIPHHLTGNTALEYYGQLSGMPLSEIHAKRNGLLDTVGLGKWGRTPVRNYSKGMQQRLGLAQAMLHDPDLLILDEPTDGVDPVGRAEIRDVLFQLKDRGKTVFLNSHLLQEIELVCDRVAILHAGLVRHVGPVRELTDATSNCIVYEVRGPLSDIELLVESDATLDFGENLRDDAGSTEETDGTMAMTADGEPDSDLPGLGDADHSTAPVSVTLIQQPHSQADVDAAVDALRELGVSIESMSRERLTLEQAFLQLLKAHEADGSQATATDFLQETTEETEIAHESEVIDENANGDVEGGA
ncbi:ATP-binding cassette domain-containing protein [bacterium]|nr:ATP-binding cassette domain-containing protein [bacterium]